MDEKNCNQKTVNEDVENAWICPECKDPQSNFYVRGLCEKCYRRRLRRKHGILPKKPFNRPCQKCGKSPVRGQDMCCSCYDKHYRKNHKGKIRTQNRTGGEKRNFGGRRNEILQAYRCKCALCGMSDDNSFGIWGARLTIHHKDGNGRASDIPNHKIENLMVLCKICHRKEHTRLKKESISEQC